MIEFRTPMGWRKDKLANIADFYNGAAFNAKDWVEDGLPIIRIEQLSNKDAETDKYSGPLLPINYIDDEDLIFSWSATLKVVLWNRGPGALNQHLYKVVPKTGINKYLLRHLLDFNMENLAGQSQGSTMKHVTKKELSRFSVIFPERENHQKNIASILESIDKTIEKTEALIHKYQQIKAGLMYDLFTRGLTAGGKLRPPREQAPELYQETPIGWIPNEWGISSLSDLCYDIKDGVHYAVSRCNEGIPFLFVSCVRNGCILWEKAGRIAVDTYAVISRNCQPYKGMILFTVVGSYGHVALVEEDVPFGFERNIAYLKPNESVIEPQCFSYWLSSSSVRNQVERFVMGNAQKILTLGNLKSVLAPLMPQDEQISIAEKLKSIDKIINVEQQLMDKLKLNKKALMHDLLTGKVPVTIDDKEETAHDR